MSSTKKVVIIFGCIFLVCVIGIAVTLGVFFGNGNNNGFSSIFNGHKFEINENSSLDLAGTDAIKIEAASSDIHFVASDEARVELKGMVIPENEQKNYLSVTERDGTLLISVKNNEFLFSLFSDFDLTVYLPADNMLDAEVNCTSGNIDMLGMHFGNVELWRTSGNASIGDCTAETFTSDTTSGDTVIKSSALGTTKLTCRSGNTNISDTTGSVYVRATSGNIDITGAAETLDVGCTSGDVTLDMASGTIPAISAGLTSGNIRIYMPSGAAFDLNARTTSGNITSDLSIAQSGNLNQSYSGEDVSGTCNGGGSLVSLTVTSGNISIIAK